jgi:hypothetical protein
MGLTDRRENHRAAVLKKEGILPLPIEDLPSFRGFANMGTDPSRVAFKKTQQINGENVLKSFDRLYPDIKKISEKLLIASHSAVAIQMLDVTGKVNLWAEANPDRGCLLIDTTLHGYLSARMAHNIKHIVIPLDLFADALNVTRTLIGKSIGLSARLFSLREANSQSNVASSASSSHHPQVAYVTHQGLSFGNLFSKDLYYSDNSNSELFPTKLLHIDYSGVQCPSDQIHWICIGNHRQSWKDNLSNALKAFSVGIVHVRHFQEILGLFILVRFFVVYKSYLKKLNQYTDLKLALIDYEIICPKELILALESKGIRSIAVQERFIHTFDNLFGSAILDTYLCDSEYAAETMKRSPLYSVGEYISVGQYRSDNLLQLQKSPPPKVLEVPLSKGYRIITALGFHTHGAWQRSQPDPLLNWKAHLQFLEDMIRLSEELPDVFVILRFKDISWIHLPVFSDVLKRIRMSEKIGISDEYNAFLVSYALCAHSNLVIAKHTSIADECLSVGIPVLFHEYTHNTERLVADCFDYLPTKVMCFSYQELIERSRVILNSSPNILTNDFKYLQKAVYGDLGDGNVKKRIHEHINSILPDQ